MTESANRRIGESEKRHGKFFLPFRRLTVSPSLRLGRSGQGMSEITLMLPLFILLAGGAMAVAYICWQGIKVQQAANLAARIQGQERVSGASASDASVGQHFIEQDNGVDGGGDTVPDDASIQGLSNNPNALNGFHTKPTGGVYGKLYQAVHDMFNPGEQKKLFVPLPIQGLNTDSVEVVRVLNPPKIFDMQLKPVKLQARAYGGEDTHLYGLPRWGRDNANGQFYTSALQNPDNN